MDPILDPRNCKLLILKQDFGMNLGYPTQANLAHNSLIRLLLGGILPLIFNGNPGPWLDPQVTWEQQLAPTLFFAPAPAGSILDPILDLG